VIAPDASAAFVANMEDVLEVYQRPHDPERPVVCLDETSKQLIVETRAAVPAKPGRKARQDYEYERNGVAHLFMMFAPLEGVQKAPSAGNKRRCSAASWRALAFRLYPKVDRLIPSASHGRCAGLRGPTIKNHGRLAS